MTEKTNENKKKSVYWPPLLSALVAPGIGQIFNREYLKGFFLLLAFVGSIVWFSIVLTERLEILLPGTPDMWVQDQNLLRDGITKLITESSGMFMTFQLLLIVIWIYGIIDAYMGARKNLNSPSIQDENSDIIS
jgi:TM2 domain-containing membrane protein YozV